MREFFWKTRGQKLRHSTGPSVTFCVLMWQAVIFHLCVAVKVIGGCFYLTKKMPIKSKIVAWKTTTAGSKQKLYCHWKIEMWVTHKPNRFYKFDLFPLFFSERIFLFKKVEFGVIWIKDWVEKNISVTVTKFQLIFSVKLRMVVSL